MEGYTTGTHSSAAFKKALSLFINKDLENLKTSKVKMPNGNYASIIIDSTTITENLISVRTQKTHNEDIDVTKGAYIVCHISPSHRKDKTSKLKHKPHIIQANNTKIFIYAGKGLGVATKKGLKVKPNYPAINPAPLETIKLIADELISNETKIPKEIYSYIEIENGEKLAKDTANPQIGIIGGISILGTTGIVKPISNEAYLKTIETFISVAQESKCQSIIFTLGNTAYKFAKKQFNKESEMIIEIGNFIHSSLAMLKDKNFLELYLVVSLGKMIKIMQGNKNTHMHYGKINMDTLIEQLINIEVGAKKTIKGKKINTSQELVEYLSKINIENKLYNLVCLGALNTIKTWIEELNLNLKSIHTILLNKNTNIMKTQEL